MDRSAAAIVSSRLAALRSSRSRISSAWVSRQALVKANKKKKTRIGCQDLMWWLSRTDNLFFSVCAKKKKRSWLTWCAQTLPLSVSERRLLECYRKSVLKDWRREKELGHRNRSRWWKGKNRSKGKHMSLVIIFTFWTAHPLSSRGLLLKGTLMLIQSKPSFVM